MVSPRITHIIFDMDGLLLDTEKFYSVVQERILAAYGKTFDWSLKAKMMGKKALEAGEILVRETGLQGILTPEDFITQRDEKLHALFSESELMPGVERLIRHLSACKVPMAVATSSHWRHYELKTRRHRELFSLMHHVVVGDDPEEIPSAMENILVFEDAPNGVAAALNAKMQVVMIPDPNLDRNVCQEAWP